MTENLRASDPEQRLLVLAPTPKDARLTCEVLQRNDIECLSCANLQELCGHLREGSAGALIAEEAFAMTESKPLLRMLGEQPSWSDLPIILLMRRGQPSPFALRTMETLGNILLLERPTQSSMLVSAARAALRERRRQYTVRYQLQELKRRRAVLEENEKALKGAKAAAEEANSAKSEFLANMSHEIRTPMTTFMAAIEHLQDIEKDPEHRRILEMADQSARRLRGLIDDILDFSRIEARKVSIKEEPFDLHSFIDEIARIFDLSARKKNLRFEVEIAADLPSILLGDPDKLGQVLINLIGNAVKFTKDGEVRLSVRSWSDRLEFSVADTGIGIPEDKLELLFESFSQVDSSFTRPYGGTGLGLAISKGLVDLMEGEIFVRSREGEGSVFTCTFPLKPARNEPSGTTEIPAESSSDDSDTRILLAEDDPMIREVIAAMLNKGGFQAEFAETGREALELWGKKRVNMILMDLQMPEMNGIEATRAIREKEREGNGHTIIIGLTAHARPEVREECLSAGMDDVLIKPIQMDDLFSALRGCLDE